MAMQYSILHEHTINCYIKNVDLRSGDNYSIAIAHFYETFSNKPIFDYVTDSREYKKLQNDAMMRIIHTVQKLTIAPEKKVYHRISWHDVKFGHCSREHLHEIMRDFNMNPIEFSTIEMYAYIDGYEDNITPEQILQHQYIAVDHPNLYRYLSYNNRRFRNCKV